MRQFDDKYAKLSLTFSEKIRKKIDRFKLAPTLWELADYLESQDDGKKHEQHLIMLGSEWLKRLP